MADTDEVTSAVRKAASRQAAHAQQSLEEQIAMLQKDIKSIGATLAKLGDEKANDARAAARTQYSSLVQSGRHVVDDLGEQVNAYEGQLVEAIRERPLTAVAGAIGVGFLIALLSRR